MPGITLTEGALEVSKVDTGDELISRLQTLGEDFGATIEGWQTDRVREVLKTDRYFHAIHFPKAFQIDARTYVRGLAALAESAGVRIFEDTPVVGIDPAGIASACSRHRLSCAPPTSCLQATRISVRRATVSRQRCCRPGVMLR
jgi:glycine/D-amino acid oxidase-like deaminating enzyme